MDIVKLQDSQVRCEAEEPRLPVCVKLHKRWILHFPECNRSFVKLCLVWLTPRHFKPDTSNMSRRLSVENLKAHNSGQENTGGLSVTTDLFAQTLESCTQSHTRHYNSCFSFPTAQQHHKLTPWKSGNRFTQLLFHITVCLLCSVFTYLPLPYRTTSPATISTGCQLTCRTGSSQEKPPLHRDTQQLTISTHSRDKHTHRA